MSEIDSLALLYFVTLLICILFITLILVKLKTDIGESMQKRLFISLCVLIDLFAIDDLVWRLIDVDFLALSNQRFLIFVLNALYFVLSTIVAMIWFYYVEHRIDNDFVYRKKLLAIMYIPLGILIVGIVASLWLGPKGVFYIDELGNYHRGSIYFIHVLVSFIYMFAASTHSFRESIRHENFLRKSEYRTMAAFMFPPLIAAVLQVIVMDLPLLAVGLAFDCVLIYINSKDQEVSQDALTNMNNRNQFNKYLKNRLSHDDRDNLYLLMMDVDYFKKINDGFGHSEGDRALIIISDSLKEVAMRHSCFIARYGGDEFSVVVTSDNEDEVKEIVNDIMETVRRNADKQNKPYKLGVSVGYKRFEESLKYIPDFVTAADKMLFEVKKEHHTQRLA